MGVTCIRETVVLAEPAVVRAAVLCLATRMWNVSPADQVISEPELLVHGVRLDGETCAWLSWELTPVADGATRVRLVHDDADLGGGPEPDLDHVLAMLQRDAVAI